MPCPNRKCKKDGNCQDHHCFSLRSISSDTYYRNPVQILLCPSLDRDGKVIANSFPVFNGDDKVHTPAFCLGIDKNYSMEQDQQMLIDHMRKVKDSLEMKHQMLLPRPSHKNKYCSVCKDNYDDYKEHIDSSFHKKSIQKSKFNKHVNDLCDMFKKQQPYREEKQENTKEYIIDDEEPPIRKIKRLESVIESPDEKLQAPASSTNISSLNRQTPYIYAPFQRNYSMFPSVPFPMYYYPGMGGWPSMPFNPRFNHPQYNFSFMMPFSQPSMFSCQNINPILIADD